MFSLAVPPAAAVTVTQGPARLQRVTSNLAAARPTMAAPLGPAPAGPAWPAALCNSSRNEPGLQSLGTQLKPHNSKNRENNLIRSAMSRALCSILKRHIRHRDSLSEPASRAAAGPPARPGSEAAVEIVISQNVLRFVLWPVSEAAEDSQCNGCSMPPRPL